MTPRDRRALLLGAAVIVPAVLGSLVLRPVVALYGADRAALHAERQLLVRELGLLRDSAALAEQARMLEAALAAETPGLFTGSDPFAASAGLAAYVGDLARRHRVLVRRAETRPPVALAGGLVAVEVVVQAASDFQGVLDFLSGLEQGPRLVRAERLAVERTAGLGGQEPQRETLNVGIVLRGFTTATSVEVGAP